MSSHDPFRRFHSTAAGMLDHYRAGDVAAVNALADVALETATADEALALQRGLMFAVVELAGALADERPADPDVWIAARLRQFREPDGSA